MVVQLTRPKPPTGSTGTTALRPGRGSGPATAGAVVASAALAALVVLRHLGTKPLWRDEAISVSVATRPVTGVLWILPHHDANAGLYYLVLHGWLRLGHSSPAWARGLSAVSFVATAALASWAVSRWLGWPAGVAAGGLVATNPFLVYYGQEARPYALAVCLAVLSLVALLWRAERPAPRAYVAVTLVLVYVDLFALIFVAAVALAVVVVHRLRSEPVPRILIRCWAIIAAGSAPLTLVMVVGQRGQISWLTRPDFGVLRRTISAMSGGWTGLLAVVVLGGAAIAAAAFGSVRRDQAITAAASGVGDIRRDQVIIAGAEVGDVSRDQVIIAALAAAFMLPPLALWAISQLAPSYIDRYVICSAVAMVGLAAAGFEAVRRRAGPVVALALLAVLLTVGAQHVAQVEAGPFKVDNAPGAWSFIARHAQPGDALGYAGGGLRIVMDAAAPRSPAPVPLPVDVALAARGEAFLQHDLYAREVTADELGQRLVGVPRLWLVTDSRDRRYPSDGPFGQLRPVVTATFAATSRGSFGAIDVTLYQRRA